METVFIIVATICRSHKNVRIHNLLLDLTKLKKRVFGMEHKIKPETKIFFLAIPLLAILSFVPFVNVAINQSSVSQIQSYDNGKPPVIYTFFEQRLNEDGELEGGEKESASQQLEIWTELWRNAGWDPRILTLEDAKKHPDYDRYSKEILMTSGEKFYGALYEGSYNFMCFIRWLAMAAHGEGGWMSDFDVIPLEISASAGKVLPNGGRFTAYDRHVPSLLSGTADEWNRMSQKVLQKGIANMRKENRERIISDMFVMREIHLSSPNEYYKQETKAYFGYPYLGRNIIDCDGLRGKFYAHLSHFYSKKAILDGIIDAPNDEYDNSLRSGWARDVVRNWKDQCFALYS